MHPVLKGAAYILVHTPDMVLQNGTTQTTERVVNPDSEYLKQMEVRVRYLHSDVETLERISVYNASFHVSFS